MDHAFDDPKVEAVFAAYSEPAARALRALRSMIFETATGLEAVGEIEEGLRWGQPSYLTPHTKSGSTIRIDRIKGADDHCALYVHCQTRLVDTFKQHYPDTLTYDGNRAVLFDADAPLPKAEHRHCIALALTYHRWK